MRWLHTRAAALAACALLAIAPQRASAQAQTQAQNQAQNQAYDYPNRPVTFIVPFAPGGSTDVLARLMGKSLSERLGQSVVVDNRAGAGGNIGADAVAKSPPDGYTLVMGSIGNVYGRSAVRRYFAVGDVERRIKPLLAMEKFSF